MQKELKIHRSDKPIFIMMVGLAGSGKSTCSENISIVDNMGSVHKPERHSSDALRLEMFGDERDQEHHQEIFTELHKRIKEDLRNGKDVVYDATNINKKRRAAFLRELHRIDCSKVCVCVMTPYSVCLKRNEERERTIPENAIKKMYMNWTPPHTHEGFDAVIPVFAFNEEWLAKRYDVEELFERLNAIDQENRHHTLTIGDHCTEAASYVLKKHCGNRNLEVATLLHDIGKEFCKTYVNSKGECDGEAHYYQHQCVGAYDSMFYLKKSNFDNKDILYVSNLIYYHMHPHVAWKQSQKAADRDKRMIGDEMFADIEKLHEADLYAHIPANEFQRTVRVEEILNREGEEEIDREQQRIK